MTGGSNGLSVAVLGAGGYVGGELLRLLVGHPAVERIRALSKSQAGKSVGEVHPPLQHFRELVFEPPEHGGHEGEVVFLALPHGESQAIVPELLKDGPALIVDLAADFRIREEERYKTFYGDHESWTLVSSFRLGLADVVGTELRGADRIAIPGCFATLALLCLYPAASSGLVAGPATCFAVTGSSGSGREPRASVHHPARANNLFGYAPTGHRHEAEVVDFLSNRVEFPPGSFRLLPHSGPFVRGIHATMEVEVRGCSPDELTSLYRDHYRDSAFVSVRDRNPQLSHVVGTNSAQLFPVPASDGSRLVVYGVLDNLLKGAAGQAVQAMNLAFDFSETAGLELLGFHPC